MPRKPTTEDRIRDLLDEYEPILTAAFIEAIAEIRDGVQVQRIIKALERRDIEGAIDAVNLDRAAFRTLENAVAQAYESGGVVGASGFPKVRNADGATVIVRFDSRNVVAERILRDQSSRLVTRTVEDTKEMLRTVFSEGLSVGRGPTAMSTDVAGRINKLSGRREGGILGMTSGQERTVAAARANLRSGDPTAMRSYLDLKRRDRRFDRVVEKAIREGRAVDAETTSKIIGRLSDRYVQLRAETVARTETLTAVNAARHEAFRQGLDKTEYTAQDVTRAWDDAGDNKVRPSHRNVAPVQGLDTSFIVGGSRMMHPGDTSLGAGPEEIIQCRCVEQIRIDYFGGQG